MSEPAEDGVILDPSLRVKLKKHSLRYFTGDTLFDEVARVLCNAECLPRKELYESWEFAKRARKRLRGGRIVDLACGHGLLASIMLLLDRSSPAAVAVDTRLPKSAPLVLAALAERWPFLGERVQLIEGRLQDVALTADDVVVSAHACGRLSDVVVDRAIEAGASVAVLPCCHAHGSKSDWRYPGWMDESLAIDLGRAQRLEHAGYRVFTRKIPENITEKNRLLLGLRARAS